MEFFGLTLLERRALLMEAQREVSAARSAKRRKSTVFFFCRSLTRSLATGSM
jgi:hypothetical protein